MSDGRQVPLTVRGPVEVEAVAQRLFAWAMSDRRCVSGKSFDGEWAQCSPSVQHGWMVEAYQIVSGRKVRGGVDA